MNNTPDDEDRDDREHLDALEPDWPDVPSDLAKLVGMPVFIDGTPGAVAINPGFHAHSRRLREGFYDIDGTR